MDFKKEFPLLNKITYLDNAAGTLKPVSVIKAIENFYLNNSMNPHSSDTPLGVEANEIIEKARSESAKLIDASIEEIIFTANTTDSLNKAARMVLPLLKKDDEILYYFYSHNSLIAPFMKMSKEKEVKLRSSKDLIKDISHKTKVIIVTSYTNGFGTDVDMEALYRVASEQGIVVINDAAQKIIHEKVSLNNSDIIAFSSNKLYGPTGVGILAIKKNLLEKLKPVTYGGGAINSLSENGSMVLKEGTKSFEPGTPDTASIAGYLKGLEFLKKTWNEKEKAISLANVLREELLKIKKIKVLSSSNKAYVTFYFEDIPAQDIVTSLAQKGIYLRAGAFCSNISLPIKNGAIRASFAVYNTKEDVDKLLKELKRGDFFDYL